MTQKTIQQFKALWVTGYMPTQADFADFFDSFINCLDNNGPKFFNLHLNLDAFAGKSLTSFAFALENIPDGYYLSKIILNSIENFISPNTSELSLHLQFDSGSVQISGDITLSDAGMVDIVLPLPITKQNLSNFPETNISAVVTSSGDNLNTYTQGDCYICYLFEKINVSF